MSQVPDGDRIESSRLVGSGRITHRPGHERNHEDGTSGWGQDALTCSPYGVAFRFGDASARGMNGAQNLGRPGAVEPPTCRPLLDEAVPCTCRTRVGTQGRYGSLVPLVALLGECSHGRPSPWNIPIGSRIFHLREPLRTGLASLSGDVHGRGDVHAGGWRLTPVRPRKPGLAETRWKW